MSVTSTAAGLELGGEKRKVEIEGRDPVLPSRFELGTIAATALAELGCAAAELADAAGAKTGAVSTSVVQGAQRLISFALQTLDSEPIARTNQSNPFVRAYEGSDGRWIYLHGGFPALALGLAKLLEVSPDASFAEVAAAVKNWPASELEDAIANNNLCGGVVRTPGEWRGHAQGKALAEMGVVRTTQLAGSFKSWEPRPVKPLAGLRVLDLTRVLAGPTCGKHLASLGADVLHVRAPHVPSIESFAIDTGLGKRQAWCDFTDSDQLASLVEVAQRAHVIVTGYRPGLVAKFGLDAKSLRETGWNGIYASISCYGPEGPWSGRAGWEQLAQAVSGMQSLEGEAGNPTVTPAAATDYTTGLLMAGSICRALSIQSPANLDGSLCQTANWFIKRGAVCDPDQAAGLGTPELITSHTEVGTLLHLGAGYTVEGLEIGWSRGLRPFGSGKLRW